MQMEHCQDDHNLVLNAGKGLFMAALHVYAQCYHGFYSLIVYLFVFYFLFCGEGFGVPYNGY